MDFNTRSQLFITEATLLLHQLDKAHLADKVLELWSIGVESINVSVESKLTERFPGWLVAVDVHRVQRTDWRLVADWNRYRLNQDLEKIREGFKS